MGHDHAHHQPHATDRAFALAIVLNGGFVAVEAAAGWAYGSVALLADAGHNLSDVLGLAIAWGGAALARRPPSARFTYGLGGSTILAAMINALLLLIAIAVIVVEALDRLVAPVPAPGQTMMLVAGLGIVVNGGTALLFRHGHAHDLNLRGAYLHMAADAAVSLGVVIAGAAVLLTGIDRIDPLVSIAIAAAIFWASWGLLRDSVRMALAGVPGGIDRDQVEIELLMSPGVTRVHDLHIWPMSTSLTALTAHLVMPAGYPGDAFLEEVRHRLHHRFGIDHLTLQVETGAAKACAGEGCR